MEFKLITMTRRTNACGKQGLLMVTRGIAHLDADIGRQGASRVKQRFRQGNGIAQHHDDGHGFTDCAPDAEYDRCHDARLGRRKLD